MAQTEMWLDVRVDTDHEGTPVKLFFPRLCPPDVHDMNREQVRHHIRCIVIELYAEYDEPVYFSDEEGYPDG